MDVWIVDDDPEVRAATSALLRSMGLEVGTFESGEALLEHEDLGEASVILLDLRMGDVIRMRRKHPCGAFEWEVVRIGADVGLVCRGCRRRVLMERRTLRRRATAFVERGPEVDPAIRRAIFGDDGEDEGENRTGG